MNELDPLSSQTGSPDIDEQEAWMSELAQMGQIGASKDNTSVHFEISY